MAEQRGKLEFGRFRRKVTECDLLDVALGKAALDFAQVLFDAADHHVIAILLRDLDTAAEALWIEDFEQRREAIRVAIVRRGGKEQPMLEAISQRPNGVGNLGIDGVLLAAGGSRVVRFVQNEQRAWTEVAQPIAQAGGIGFVDE